MLNQGTLRLSLTFNPLHARQKAASGELPTDSYSFGFTVGTLGNVHFVTIPANARAVAGAKVVANFLLSPEAQLRKADAAVWAMRAYWIRSVCLTVSARRWRQPCRRICRRCLPSLTRHGLTRWSRNGCAATVPTDPAGLGGDGGDLSAAAPRRRGTGGRCALPAHWRALFADPQLSQALAATLVSTLLSVGGALLIALTIVAALWPSARWRRQASRLPLLLAVPHLALATAALLLFAEGGWLWQRLPFLTPPVDRYGIGLGLTMALKRAPLCCG